MKKIFKLVVAVFIAVTCVAPLQGIMAAPGDPVDAIRTVSRNDGGGALGTHKNASYVENGVQYYRDGDIIEVKIDLPADTDTQAYQQGIRYDSTKLELLSTNYDIQQSIDKHYLQQDWTAYVSRLHNDQNTILIYGGSNNYTIESSKDKKGGTLAKMYFRVKDGGETVDGAPVVFEFPQFQTVKNTENGRIYTHVGYDPARDSETAYYTAPAQTIYLKKPTVSFNAENGFIKQSDAKNLANANELKPYNNVSAKMTDGSNVDVAVNAPKFTSIKNGELGSYDVTYSYNQSGNTGSSNVKLNVVSDDAIISPEKTFALDAKSAFITQSDAQALADQNALIGVNKATVLLADGTSATPNVTAASFASIKAGTLGTYDVTYSYGSGSDVASKTVKVTVVKDGSIISPNEDVSLYAENGFIKQADAKALASKDALIPYNNAEVVLLDGSKPKPTVDVSSSEWLAINIGTVGSYDVLYSYGSGSNTVNKRVKITVIKDGSEISPDKKASIYAQDAEISETEAKALTDVNALITLNNASVTLSDGSVLTPVISAPDYAKIKAGTIGNYHVEYSYGSGDTYVSKTVTLRVVEDKKHVITAEDKIITVDQAKALNAKEDLRTVNNVYVTAIDGTHPNAVVETNDWASIKAGTLGKYTITYSYGTGDKLVKATANVVIVENGSIINDKASLFAKSAFVTESVAKSFTVKEDLIPVNQAKVTLIDGTNANPTVQVNSAYWNLLKDGELGVYEVTYLHGSGSDLLSKKVNTTVIKDGSEISPNEEVSLYASNAFIQSSDAKKLVNKEQLRTYNKALVTLVDGSTANPAVNVSAQDWLAIQQGKIGSYDVLYSYGSGQSEVNKIVKIVVVADNPEISPNDKVALNATNGEIADTDAKKVTKKEDLIPYNNAVVTLEDGTTVNPEVAISTNNLNAIKEGKLGKYTIVYYYGEEGTDNYVEKTVTLEVVKKTEERLLFDYDKNGRIDVLDFTEFKRIFSDPGSATSVEMLLSDANSDGRVDVIDLSECQYYLSNPTVTPPTILVPIQ